MSVCIYRERHTSDRQERERKTESKRARDRGKDDEEDRWWVVMDSGVPRREEEWSSMPVNTMTTSLSAKQRIGQSDITKKTVMEQ